MLVCSARAELARPERCDPVPSAGGRGVTRDAVADSAGGSNCGDLVGRQRPFSGAWQKPGCFDSGVHIYVRTLACAFAWEWAKRTPPSTLSAVRVGGGARCPSSHGAMTTGSKVCFSRLNLSSSNACAHADRLGLCPDAECRGSRDSAFLMNCPVTRLLPATDKPLGGQASFGVFASASAVKQSS